MFLRRKHRLWLKRSLFAFLVLLALFYFGLFSPDLLSSAPKFELQNEIFKSFKADPASYPSNHRAILYGIKDNWDFKGLKFLLESFQEKGVKFATVDIGKYPNTLKNIPSDSNTEPKEAFLVIDNKVVGTHSYLVSRPHFAVLNKILKRKKLPYNPDKSKVPKYKNNFAKLTFELDNTIEQQIVSLMASNDIAIILPEKSDPTPELHKIVKTLVDKHFFNRIDFRLNGVKDGDHVYSPSFGRITIPCVFFNNQQYTFDEFIMSYNQDRFEDIILEKSESDNVDGISIVDAAISQQKAVLFLSSGSAQSNAVSALFEKYRSELGLVYHPQTIGFSNKNYASVAQNLIWRNNNLSPFPNLNKLDAAEKEAKTFLKSSLRKYKYVVIAKAKDSLVTKIQNQILEKNSPSDLITLYTTNNSTAFPLSIALRTISDSDDLPLVYMSGKLAFSGIAKLTSLTNEKKLVLDDSKPNTMTKFKIEELIKKNKIMVFSKTYCPFCRAAKSLLDDSKIKFTALEVNTLSNPREVKGWLREISNGHNTFPNIFINGKSIGGNYELQLLKKDNKLLSIINPPRETQANKPSEMTDEQIKKIIVDLIISNPIMVFSKTYCPFCKKAKALLSSSNLKYKAFEADIVPYMPKLKSLLGDISGGHYTFPNIFINGKSIGGASDLEHLIGTKQIISLLSSDGQTIGSSPLNKRNYSKKELQNLISDNQVMMFSKRDCKFSVRAKSDLIRNKVNFYALEIDDVLNDSSVKSHLGQLSNGHSTFPNIFINGKSVGGSDELDAIIRAGQLSEILNS
ncbi:hypothetical protein BB560_000231 [Smittium megazygosporum]|uniref:Glutaredoxin domain-containing protein n=1 Tax=Smittium megazygosporum TaxID=133381 RepID=A0A2T9ZL24_9FUNG|nr:hypothetical protein BB560_000231 [Smittium megazygosporum]